MAFIVFPQQRAQANIPSILRRNAVSVRTQHFLRKIIFLILLSRQIVLRLNALVCVLRLILFVDVRPFHIILIQIVFQHPPRSSTLPPQPRGWKDIYPDGLYELLFRIGLCLIMAEWLVIVMRWFELGELSNTTFNVLVSKQALAQYKYSPDSKITFKVRNLNFVHSNYRIERVHFRFGCCISHPISQPVSQPSVSDGGGAGVSLVDCVPRHPRCVVCPHHHWYRCGQQFKPYVTSHFLTHSALSVCVLCLMCLHIAIL